MKDVAAHAGVSLSTVSYVVNDSGPVAGDRRAKGLYLTGYGRALHARLAALVNAHETRLARAVALAYGLSSPPSAADLVKLSENWRPYRTWVTLLMRAQLEDETGEISGVRHRNT